MIYLLFLSCFIYDLGVFFFLSLMNLASDLHSHRELACLMETMENLTFVKMPVFELLKYMLKYKHYVTAKS